MRLKPIAIAAITLAPLSGFSPSSIAVASTVTTTVAGTANPWDLTANPTLPFDNNRFGNGPGTGPTVVTDGFDFSAGNQFVLSASGIINVGGGQPDNGPSGIPSFNYGPSDGVPSDHTSGPYLAGELIGSFANSSGTVVGSPFVVGNGGTFKAPAGASELLFGINDSSFGDNTGSFSVAVSGSSVSAVPLPASAPLFGAALMALGAVRYGLNRKAKAVT